jgi:lysine 2,3-aminomutase
LARIRTIASVDIIRLASRMLTFAPMRVCDDLVSIIKRHNPVYLMSHFNHINELGDATRVAIAKLVDAGIPVLNQTVLLRGINDNAQALTELFRELTKLRVRPYYLHQCDLAPGTSAFRVPFDEALALVKGMRGHVSGLSMPQFIVDIPGGFGKVPMVPNPIVGRDDEYISLQGFDGEVAQYPLY